MTKKKFFEVVNFNPEYICIRIGKLRFVSVNKDCLGWGFSDLTWDNKYSLMMHFDILSKKACLPAPFATFYSDPDDGVPELCVYRVSYDDDAYLKKRMFSTNWLFFR